MSGAKDIVMRFEFWRVPLSARAGRAAGAALMLLLAAMWVAPSRAQGVHAGLLPAEQSVSLDTDFDLEIDVTQAGAAFNGFNAVVEYDTTMIRFVAQSPISLQEGCLMTGSCSGACGSTFHRFTADADSLAIRDFLLCNQIVLAGPGQIYKLHFHALTTPGVTNVDIRSATFFNAGLFVTPVATANARVGVGVTLAVGEPRPVAAGLRLRAEPNPSRAPVRFAIESDAAGEQTLEIYDVSGRLIRRLDSGWRGSGAWQSSWDGTDDSGRRVPAGVYLATLRSGARIARVRVAVIQ